MHPSAKIIRWRNLDSYQLVQWSNSSVPGDLGYQHLLPVHQTLLLALGLQHRQQRVQLCRLFISVRPGTQKGGGSLPPKLWLSTAQRGSLPWRRRSSILIGTCRWKILFQTVKIFLRFPPCCGRESRKILTKETSWKASVFASQTTNHNYCVDVSPLLSRPWSGRWYGNRGVFGCLLVQLLQDCAHYNTSLQIFEEKSTFRGAVKNAAREVVKSHYMPSIPSPPSAPGSNPDPKQRYNLVKKEIAALLLKMTFTRPPEKDLNVCIPSIDTNNIWNLHSRAKQWILHTMQLKPWYWITGTSRRIL